MGWIISYSILRWLPLDRRQSLKYIFWIVSLSAIEAIMIDSLTLALYKKGNPVIWMIDYTSLTKLSMMIHGIEGVNYSGWKFTKIQYSIVTKKIYTTAFLYDLWLLGRECHYTSKLNNGYSYFGSVMYCKIVTFLKIITPRSHIRTSHLSPFFLSYFVTCKVY